MFTLDVTLDTDVLDAVQDAITRAPRTMQTFIGKTVAQDVMGQMLTELRSEPPPPSYPLKWRSEKQRKFVMAKLRREGNLPYRRTGRLIAGWRVMAQNFQDGVLLTLQNDTPYIHFVVGGEITETSIRQPMFPHWYNADAIVERHALRASDLIIDAWFDILETAPGVFA